MPAERVAKLATTHGLRLASGASGGYCLRVTVAAMFFMPPYGPAKRQIRRRSYPGRFRTTADRAEIKVRYTTEDSAASPAFRLQIGLPHLGETPNVRADEPDHDPGDPMSVHEPTHVDGMHYDTFTPGGLTAGGAREYVSKLNNTQAIDRVEMIE